MKFSTLGATGCGIGWVPSNQTNVLCQRNPSVYKIFLFDIIYIYIHIYVLYSYFFFLFYSSLAAKLSYHQLHDNIHILGCHHHHHHWNIKSDTLPANKLIKNWLTTRNFIYPTIFLLVQPPHQALPSTFPSLPNWCKIPPASWCVCVYNVYLSIYYIIPYLYVCGCVCVCIVLACEEVPLWMVKRRKKKNWFSVWGSPNHRNE